MGRIKKGVKIIKVLEIISSILPMLFWGLVLFSFEEEFLAINTVLSALIHELGHIICITLISEKDVTIKSVINGFRIKNKRVKSYGEELIIYLSGSLANLFVFLICLVLSQKTDQRLMNIGMVNLATALSNLMPIKGYDGYGAIRALIKKNEYPPAALRGLSVFSSYLIFIFCIFSLDLIDRYAGGYWIFAVFFVSMIKEMDAGLKERF